jgi:hypothetical protein
MSITDDRLAEIARTGFDARTEVTEEELRQLCHELLHVRQGDIAVQRDQAVAEVAHLRAALGISPATRVMQANPAKEVIAQITARCEFAEAKCAALLAENARMRPIYEAAKAWRRGANEPTYEANAEQHAHLEQVLERAVDAARAAETAPDLDVDLTAQLAGAFHRAVEAGRAPASRPERISLPTPTEGKNWEIRDIRIGNVAAPPYTDEDRRRDEQRALRHDPLVARTMIGGPGNHRRIMACACKAPGVRDAATWAAHVGVPGAGSFLTTIFMLQDAVQDAIDYPNADTFAGLVEALRRVQVVAPKDLPR